MKRILIILIAVAFANNVKAQMGYNYAQFDLGFAAALNRTNTDFLKPQTKPAGNINLTYNYSPFINFIGEIQFGSMAGDSIKNTPGTYFSNNYTSLAFRAQIQAGEVIDYADNAVFNALKNFYVSVGVGVIYTRNQLYSQNELLGNGHISNFFVPAKVGYELKIFNNYNEPTFKIDLGYQFNYAFSDNLDGYVSGNNRDSFTGPVIGFKFALGAVTSYRKAIGY